MRKNPVVAGVLNFFFPGIGFAYLGTPTLIVCGILYFLVESYLGFCFMFSGADVGAAFWVFDLFASVLMAFLAAGVAIELNRRLGRPPRAEPAVPSVTAPATADVVFCTHCGASNPEEARYCHKCGKPIAST